MVHHHPVDDFLNSCHPWTRSFILKGEINCWSLVHVTYDQASLFFEREEGWREGMIAGYTAWGDGKDILLLHQVQTRNQNNIFDFLSFIYIFWININYNLIILFTAAYQLKDHPFYSFTTLRIILSRLNCYFVVINLFSYKIRMIYWFNVLEFHWYVCGKRHPTVVKDIFWCNYQNRLQK